MGKEQKMTYSFYVSIAGKEPVDMAEMTEEERKDICQKLCRQYIEKGLGGEVVTA